jgi:hypothetical protein
VEDGHVAKYFLYKRSPLPVKGWEEQLIGAIEGVNGEEYEVRISDTKADLKSEAASAIDNRYAQGQP